MKRIGPFNQQILETEKKENNKIHYNDEFIKLPRNRE